MRSDSRDTLDTQVVLGVTFTALAAVVAGIGVLLMAALALATWIVGAGLEWPSVGDALATVSAMAGDPVGGPAPQPWAALQQAPMVFLVIAAALITAAAVVVVVLAGLAWRRWGPTQAGHATRAQLRSELSETNARERARETRPSLTVTERRGLPPEELGVPLPRGPAGPLWAAQDNHTGALAPTRAGKTTTDQIPKALAAPGALWCSSSQRDMFLHTALARTRRPQAGPVQLLDATATVDFPAQAYWPPMTGCTDAEVADRRAGILVETSGSAGRAAKASSSGNEEFFREHTIMVLRAYLFAAAVANKPVEDLVAWAANPHHKDPLAILKGAHTQLYEELNAERQEDPRTSGGVWMGVRQVVGPWVLNRALHQMCSPPTGRGLDLRSFIGQHGSLYVIGGSRRTRSAVPLLTALAEEFILAAEALAGDYPHERLDPPASVVLDELTNATPIPQLPSLLSQVAGNGISIHWAAQSMSQLEGTYGPVGARSVIGNTTALSVWGGIPDPATLEMLSTLMGQRQQVRTQYQQDGILSPSRTSVGTEWVPILRAGEIRQIPRGQVLLVYRHLGAILAHTTPLSHRRDAAQILADADTLRGRAAPVDPAGYAHRAATTASAARDR